MSGRWCGLVVAVLLAAGGAGGLVGCGGPPEAGYTTRSIYDESIATVAVPIFENESFVRDVEFELTDAFIKELQARTPYRIAASRRADTLFVGTIRRVELRSLSKSPDTGLSSEQILSVTVDFRWEDLRSGRLLVGREEFESGALFRPSSPAGEPIEVGQYGVVQDLARDMVSEMQAAW